MLQTIWSTNVNVNINILFPSSYHLHKNSHISHPSLPFIFSPISVQLHSVNAHAHTHVRSRPEPLLAQLPDTQQPTTTTTATATLDDGPIELPPSTPTIFATSDNPSPLQVTTSLLLTGAISVFLFRSLRRRARRSKELKFRSSGGKKSLKEEAIESLKDMTPAASVGEAKKGPPSAAQALLGGLSAGVIALILYKFTTTIESALNRQTLSDNFSVRQITITIRTIVNGLCYLATFVFGVNSVGLFLYSGQLAVNSVMGEPTSKKTDEKDETASSSANPAISESSETKIGNGDRSSNDTEQQK